ncbi:MAG: PEP-CTERM sorting domain-containing protein [Tepidisphaerales bacterium]
MRRWAVGAVVLGLCGGAWASVTPVDRFEILSLDAVLRLADDQQNPIVFETFLSENAVQNTLLPSVFSASLAGSGTLLDVTSTTTVATASASGSHTSTLTFSPMSLLLEASGRLDAQGALVDLDLYDPSTPYDSGTIDVVAVYNSALRFLLPTLPADYELEVTLSEGLGTVFHDGFLYEDVNDNGFYEFGTDVLIADLPLVFVNGSSSLSGTIPPSPNPYGVLLFGNTSDRPNLPGSEFVSGANYTARFSLTVIPEPASAGLLGAAGAVLLGRRRRA